MADDVDDIDTLDKTLEPCFWTPYRTCCAIRSAVSPALSHNWAVDPCPMKRSGQPMILTGVEMPSPASASEMAEPKPPAAAPFSKVMKSFAP